MHMPLHTRRSNSLIHIYFTCGTVHVISTIYMYIIIYTCIYLDYYKMYVYITCYMLPVPRKVHVTCYMLHALRVVGSTVENNLNL